MSSPPLVQSVSVGTTEHEYVEDMVQPRATDTFYFFFLSLFVCLFVCVCVCVYVCVCVCLFFFVCVQTRALSCVGVRHAHFDVNTDTVG